MPTPPAGVASSVHHWKISGNKYKLKTNKFVQPMETRYFGKKVPDWYSANDPTLILRRAQLEFRVSEVKQVFEYIERLNKGLLAGSDLLVLRDGSGNFQDLATPRVAKLVRQFKGRFDLKGNLVMAGHSFGGATSVQILREMANSREAFEKRPFKCGLLLDPCECLIFHCSHPRNDHSI